MNIKRRNTVVKVRTKDIIEKFNLELISGEEGINRPITMSDISRPGIELAGYFDYYPADRIQLIGKTELTFAEKLSERGQSRTNGKTVYRCNSRNHHCKGFADSRTN